jgi:hypothetical protein
MVFLKNITKFKGRNITQYLIVERLDVRVDDIIG